MTLKAKDGNVLLTFFYTECPIVYELFVNLEYIFP